MTPILPRIAKRVPAPLEQRQRIGGESAEIVDERCRSDLSLPDRAQADEGLEPHRRGYLRVADILEAARRALQRALVGELQARGGEPGCCLLERLGGAGGGRPQPRQLPGIGRMKPAAKKHSSGERWNKARRDRSSIPSGSSPRPRWSCRGPCSWRSARRGGCGTGRRLAVALEGHLRLGEASRSLLDEVAQRRPDRFLVGLAILLERFLGLVESQRLEERKRLRPEFLKRHTLFLRDGVARADFRSAAEHTSPLRRLGRDGDEIPSQTVTEREGAGQPNPKLPFALPLSRHLLFTRRRY